MISYSNNLSVIDLLLITHHLPHIFEDIDQMCIKDLNLNDEKISKVKIAQDELDFLINLTGNLKCFKKCVLEKDKAMNIYIAAFDEYPDNDMARIFKDMCSEHL